MAICSSCNGVIGRDCFNPQECAEILHAMANDSGRQEVERRLECREREFVLTIIAVMHSAGLKRLPVLQRHMIEANLYTLTRHEDPTLPGHVFTITSDAP